MHDICRQIVESVDLFPCNLVQVITKASLVQEFSVIGKGLIHMLKVLAENQLVLGPHISILVQVLRVYE